MDELTAGAQWPSAGRSRTADAGGPVHLTEYGEPDAPEVIVCLHGLGGSALNFGLVAPLLAQGRRVLVPDLLGHGHSYATAHDEPAVEAQLRMLSELLALETAHPVVLVGHSMGGILAMMHASRSPGSVKALVLLDPPVPNVTRFSRDPRLSAKLAFLRLPRIAAMVARQVARMTPEQLVARQLSQATPHHDRIPKEVVDATVRETASVRGPDGGRGAQRAQFRAILEVVALLARPGPWRSQLADIAAPTLWLHGTDDPLANIDGAQALASSHLQWQFRTRDGVGHLPHLEDPAWTAQSIEEWLNEQDSQVTGP